ncbi:deubiquitinase OTUD6B-like [Branchiostoma lanceolatum]|uniref:deubiquitinase OTUD6B-like n=1 Tax=Branchiostoma lanceolatum TaxID=7740 RepID=UPI0034515335
MADEGEENLSPAEKLAKKHKQERKELQAKLQQMKNSVPKNDKKRKKQLTVEIAQLEAELDERHLREEAELQAGSGDASEEQDAVTEGVGGLQVTDAAQGQQPQKQKVSKAQKRREKKAAKDKERDQRIAESEVDNLSGARHMETQKIKALLRDRQLAVKEISSDGHCLYNAVAEQLKQVGDEKSMLGLRQLTAEYMKSHTDDFLPFLSKHDTGDPYTPEEFEDYCNDIANTAAWGGQLELQALSRILKCSIEVIQAEGPAIKIGEEYDTKLPIILTYHRHMYGLGEHYNTVRPLAEELAEEEDS